MGNLAGAQIGRDIEVRPNILRPVIGETFPEPGDGAEGELALGVVQHSGLQSDEPVIGRGRVDQLRAACAVAAYGGE